MTSSDVKSVFIDVSNEVLSYLGVEHKFMREVPESTLNTTTHYNVLVGVSGTTEGNIMFGTDKKVVKDLVGKLMGVSEIKEIDIYAKSALADLYADFCKRVLGLLELEGSVFSTDPTYIAGDSMKAMISQTPAINLFFKVNGEKFQIAYNLINNG